MHLNCSSSCIIPCAENFRYATEHRCGVVVKGPKLSGNISGTDPLKDNRLLLKAEPLDDSFDAKNTAEVINELSKEISKKLVSHPLNKKRAEEGRNIANLVLLRGCGIRIEVSLPHSFFFAFWVLYMIFWVISPLS
jgi:2,3-bisphosphoglycerate-independent phosphoglycerate mutase